MIDLDADKMTLARYEGLAFLVRYGNLYQLRVMDYPGKTEETHDWWRAMDPESPDDIHEGVHDEVVQWLLGQGYARKSPDFDFMFARGKVLPTATSAARLEEHGLTRESEGVGVHLSHCCLRRHGCKYGDEFCPVVVGMFPPDHERCGACYEDDAYRDEEMEGYSDRDLIEELESRGYRVEKLEDED